MFAHTVTRYKSQKKQVACSDFPNEKNGSYLKNNNRGIGGLNKVNVLKMMIIYDLASKT